jgi:hypothetical protein
MTPEQSRKLKPGDRVYFNHNSDDVGTVKEIRPRYLTINWDDGYQSITAHSEMKRIGLRDERRTIQTFKIRRSRLVEKER